MGEPGVSTCESRVGVCVAMCTHECKAIYGGGCVQCVRAVCAHVLMRVDGNGACVYMRSGGRDLDTSASPAHLPQISPTSLKPDTHSFLSLLY